MFDGTLQTIFATLYESKGRLPDLWEFQFEIDWFLWQRLKESGAVEYLQELYEGKGLMKWLTQKQVDAAAKKGKLPALECSDLHWTQLIEATEEELRKKINQTEGLIEGRYCACCCASKKCRNCLLCGQPVSCCKGRWGNASSALNRWRRNSGTHADFVKAARAVRRYIRVKIKEYKGRVQNEQEK